MTLYDKISQTDINKAKKAISNSVCGYPFNDDFLNITLLGTYLAGQYGASKYSQLLEDL